MDQHKESRKGDVHDISSLIHVCVVELSLFGESHVEEKIYIIQFKSYIINLDTINTTNHRMRFNNSSCLLKHGKNREFVVCDENQL